MWPGLVVFRPRGFPTPVRRTLCLPVGVFRIVAVGYNVVSFEEVVAGVSDVVEGGAG